MPYIPHVRITARFNLGASSLPVEQASCSLSFAEPLLPQPPPAWQELCDDAFTDWAAWMARSTSKVSSSVKLMETRLYRIGTDGHSADDTVLSSGTPVSGTVDTNQHPFQCATVITLEAGSRGVGRFGRIYLPPCGFLIGTDGLIYPSQVDDAFASAKTLLNDLSNKAGFDAGWKLVIAGRTGTGTLREVQRVRMGKVMDTQRRRRRSLKEAYLSDDFDA